MNVVEILKREKVVAVLRAPDPDTALEYAMKAVDSGMIVIEVTFTIPDALSVMESLGKLDGILLGAGTVMGVRECEKAIERGARFVVSPHLDGDISECADRYGIPYFPGVMTPTEIATALKMKRRVLKLFPSGFLGPAYIKSMKGPFPDVDFIPTGGVNPSNMCDWLMAGCIAVGVGSYIFKGDVGERVKEILKARERCIGR